MNYIEINFLSSPESSDILIALLAENGFDMFEKTESGVKAYIDAKKFSEEELKL